MACPQWEDAVNAFLTHALASGKAQGTVGSYRDTLKDFLRVVHPGAISEIVDGDVSCYALHLYSNKARNTVRVRLLGLRVFFDYCWRVGWCESNPARHLDVPPGEEPAIWPFSYAELRRMANVCSTPREQALYAMLVCSNARASEICDMRLEFIDWASGRILVNGKGYHQRWIAPGKTVMDYLDHYLREERRRQGRGWLFVGQRGKLSRWGLWRIVRACADKAGVPHAHPHRFRHTFATYFLERRAGTEGDLQLIMGHSSPVMSRRYARTSEARRALEAHERFSAEIDASVNGTSTVPGPRK